MMKKHRHIQSIRVTIACLLLSLFAMPKNATAYSYPCASCPCSDVNTAKTQLETNFHIPGRNQMLADMAEDFHLHREWLVRDFFDATILPSLMLMTEQMSNIAMMQMQLVGEMIDAKLHLESMRLFTELENEANRDYYPSESFCWFGTNTKSLSASEQISKYNQGALNALHMTRQLGTVFHSAGAADVGADKWGRWLQFIADNCDPNDNNRTATAGTGLQLACGGGASDESRTNRDIDFTRFIDQPRTLNLDFTDGTSSVEEEDVLLLSSNLYGHDVIRRDISNLDSKQGQSYYYDLRSTLAKRSVAQNSFDAIVGMKVSGSSGSDTAIYLAAILSDLGMSTDEIANFMQTNPSYYAQLEILGQKMFQNVEFFTDLYDKPANTKRKMAALNAIEMMLDRAIYESELRQEMLYSVLLSSYLDKDLNSDYARFVSTSSQPRN